MADRLQYSIRRRRAFEQPGFTVTPRASADFVINGQSVVDMLDRAENNVSDRMGCFVVGFDDQNLRAAGLWV